MREWGLGLSLELMLAVCEGKGLISATIINVSRVVKRSLEYQKPSCCHVRLGYRAENLEELRFAAPVCCSFFVVCFADSFACSILVVRLDSLVLLFRITAPFWEGLVWLGTPCCCSVLAVLYPGAPFFE